MELRADVSVIGPGGAATVKAPDKAPRLLHVFPSFALGGAQRRLAALINHFGHAFHHIIRPLDRGAAATCLLSQNSCWHVDDHGMPRAGLFQNILYARRETRRISPDILVTHNWGSIEWAAANLLGGPRHIHIEDGFGPEESESQLRRRVLFRRLVLNRRSTVVVPSLTLRAIATDVWRIAPGRIVYLPNGISCARFSLPPAPNFSEFFKDRGTIIGTIATLRKEKALHRLIEAFALVRARNLAHLVIVGDGVERATLEAAVAARGLTTSTTFTGALAEPERILGAFQIFAMSSDTEQMPLSLLEAMAAGLPVVSTDVGDVGKMVAAENKPFIVPKSPPDLAEAIGRLIAEPRGRERVGRANRMKAQAEFDEGLMFKRYHSLFLRA